MFEVVLGLLLGATVLGCSAAAVYVLYRVIEIYGKRLLWIAPLYTIAGVTALLIVGGTGHLIFRYVEGERWLCPGCMYSYNNAFAEWWHKRKCLAFNTKYRV